MSNLNSSPGNLVRAPGRDAAEPTSPQSLGREPKHCRALLAGAWLGMGMAPFFGFLLGHKGQAEELRSVGS